MLSMAVSWKDCSKTMSSPDVVLMVTSISFVFVALGLCIIWFSGVVTDAIIFEWEVFSACGFCFKLSVFTDFLSVLFSFVVCLISGCVFMFSVTYMEEDRYWKTFSVLVFAFVVSMNILIFLPNLVFVLLGWDLLGIVSFLLVVYYQNKSAVGAGLLTVLMNRIGDVFLILAIGVSSMGGVWGVSFMGIGSMSLVLALLVGASMTKSAQVPFSAWLPAAMAAPTPVSALVHSSTLVTVGVYFLFRHFSALILLNELLCILAKIGCVTFLMGSLGACFEVDVKKLIASSTLSHLGFMTYSLSAGYPMLSVFHLLSHALFKSLLFLCAGFSIHSLGSSQDVRYMAGIGWSSPSLQLVSVIISLSSLCGVPYLSGFYSKDAILEATMTSFVGIMEGFSLLVGAMGSWIYSLRLTLDSVYQAMGGFPLKGISKSSVYVSVPISVLSLGSVSFGALIGCSWVEALQIFSLSHLTKMVLFLALNFGLVSWMKEDFDGWLFAMTLGENSKMRLNITTFLGSMWLLRWGVFCFSKMWFGKSLQMVSAVESGWVEILAGDLGPGNYFIELSFNAWLLEMISIPGVLRLAAWVGSVIFLWFVYLG
uniref:NADH-ubiquinone oxidoreductase chain 5 n=1 Tax=Lens contradens TaxID=2771348 RepID=A0A8A3WFP5_9BIVA|nr:NADH dehydrogenase subunit 5 [Lens contradens]